MEESEGECRCQLAYSSKYTKYGELAFLMMGFVVGILTVFYMLYTLFNETEKGGGSNDL